MTTDKIAEKIAKLLRKAESTDSPHEAEALTAAAEKLMLKHAIDRAMLDLDPKHKQDKIVAKPFTIEGPEFKRRAKVDMIHAIALALGLRTYYTPGKKVTQMYIVGFESDVDDALTLVASLNLQAEVALNHWWTKTLEPHERSIGYSRMIKHRDFIVGFGHGASSRIREERKSAADEVGTGAELVLADRTKKIDEYVNTLGLRKSRSGNGRNDFDAAGAGSAAGRNANLGRKDLTQGRGITA